MTIIQFQVGTLASRLNEPVPVAAPIGEPVSRVASTSIAADHDPSTRAGYWTCTAGQWRRQVKQAEFCHFLSGACSFTPDGGETIEVRAGDVLFFPENSTGIWDVRETSSKIFLVFDEKQASRNA